MKTEEQRRRLRRFVAATTAISPRHSGDVQASSQPQRPSRLALILAVGGNALLPATQPLVLALL